MQFRRVPELAWRSTLPDDVAPVAEVGTAGNGSQPSGAGTATASAPGPTPTATASSATPPPAATPTPPSVPPKPSIYMASIYPKTPILPDFAKAIQKLETALAMPVWLISQVGQGATHEISNQIAAGIQKHCADIDPGKPIALVLDSPGGDAHAAYRISRMFQRRCGPFVAVIPRYAKSAATLIALGAQKLIIGRDAELGPLDVQMLDREREDFGSALDAVQALERLNAFSMTAVDQLMNLLYPRSGKKVEWLLPQVLEYTSKFVRPLLEKIDTVDYTRKSRDLKIAEEYALRLMKPNYPFAQAKRIAGQLVEKYPTHGFVIDAEEAASFTQIAQDEHFGLGLNVMPQSADIEKGIEELLPHLGRFTVVGRIKELQP